METQFPSARPYETNDRGEWLRLRLALWRGMNADEHLVAMDLWLARPDTVVFVVPRSGGTTARSAPREADASAASAWSSISRRAPASVQLAGFAEVGTRDYGESCETSPVAYLEGWFVDADARRRGVGSSLVRAGQDWARNRGFRELCSDTEIDNQSSQSAHRALGFTETERLVLYRKVL